MERLMLGFGKKAPAGENSSGVVSQHHTALPLPLWELCMLCCAHKAWASCPSRGEEQQLAVPGAVPACAQLLSLPAEQSWSSSVPQLGLIGVRGESAKWWWRGTNHGTNPVRGCWGVRTRQDLSLSPLWSVLKRDRECFWSQWGCAARDRHRVSPLEKQHVAFLTPQWKGGHFKGLIQWFGVCV